MADLGRSRVVAAFDFDGTLVPGDSLVPFVWKVAGPRRFFAAALRHGIRVLLATGLGVGSRDAAKGAFVERAMRGLPIASVVDEAERYAERLASRVGPDAHDRIAWHKGQGHELVLISASLHVYLGPLGRLLGFDAVLATGLEVDRDGSLTGRLDGANVRGREKVDRLRRWLVDEPCELWAYGDSPGDRELLAEADHGFLVKRGGFPDLPDLLAG